MANYFDVTSCKQFPLKVKASILRLYNKKTKECTHLFSVFECIEPDMQIKDNHNVFDLLAVNLGHTPKSRHFSVPTFIDFVKNLIVN